MTSCGESIDVGYRVTTRTKTIQYVKYLIIFFTHEKRFKNGQDNFDLTSEQEKKIKMKSLRKIVACRRYKSSLISGAAYTPVQETMTDLLVNSCERNDSQLIGKCE